MAVFDEVMDAFAALSACVGYVRAATHTRAWARGDVKSLKGQLDWHVLHYELYYSRAAIRASIEAPGARQRIVVSGLRGFRAMLVERERSQRDAADSFARTRVYGAATPEMVERFAGLADGCLADIAKLNWMIARVEIEGLPVEVEAYLPERVERGGPTEAERAYGCRINRMEYR